MTRPVDSPSDVSQQNPYAAPRAEGSGAPVPPALDFTFEELAAFVGPRHVYYWTAWARSSSNHPLFAGFNWAAALFNGGWLLYRKMFRECFILLGVFIGIGFVFALLEDVIGVGAASFDRAINIAIVVVSGLLGNGLYLRRARLAIAEARRREPDPVKRNALLARKGGCSWLWPILGMALSVAVGLLVAIMAEA